MSSRGWAYNNKKYLKFEKAAKMPTTKQSAFAVTCAYTLPVQQYRTTVRYMCNVQYCMAHGTNSHETIT